MFQTGTSVTVELSGDGGDLTGDAVVLAVGMVPDTTLAEGARLEIDRGVIVDDGQQTSNFAVLAVGDSARVRRDGVLQLRAEHWEAAQRDGQRAAATILGEAGPPESAPWFWTDRHGRHVEVIGQVVAAEQTVIRGEFGSASFASFGLRGEEVVSVVAVDDATAAKAARRMIDRRIAVNPSELQDRATDLRTLTRR